MRSFEVPTLAAPAADTHGHLTCFWEKDPVACLLRAAQAGVQFIVTLFDPVGDDMKLDAYQRALRTWLDTASTELEVSSPAVPTPAVPQVRYLVGVHPYGAAHYTEELRSTILLALNDPQCAGIGEIGLDYHVDAEGEYAPAPREVQLAALADQLRIAHEYQLPVELHVRNDDSDPERQAHADVFQLLRELGVPETGCVLHCFGEDRTTMEQAVDLGCYIAYGGAATFNRNEAVRDAFAATPLERIVFETDCPYMAPMPLRGTECEPAMIAFTIDALSKDRALRTGEDPAIIQYAAWENANRLFSSAALIAPGKLEHRF
ncbi:TatD family hydrolase [Collinsella sp. AGMB00827]|uniref:TatD family hydrolase n=2 Tax=Collinsella ureilytica TaxID=2869515 RepID=A0ABS7MIL1_9ACTN|nr:TatD family hydrolase [Collinsella urealyticum]MBY4797208.1 TatD family hydrolase [Collinsella urealyticum]